MRQKGLVAIIVIFLIIVVAAGLLIYLGKNLKPLQKSAQSIPTPIASNTPSEIPAINTVSQKQNFTSGQYEWKTYTNTKYGFLIGYPSQTSGDFKGEWKYEEFATDTDLLLSVGFGPESTKSGGYLWGVHVFTSGADLEKLMDEAGKQFSDRKVKKEQFQLLGENATIQTVTTSSHPDWVSKTVYVKHGSYLYKLSNGAVDNNEFTNFYLSLRFTK